MTATTSSIVFIPPTPDTYTDYYLRSEVLGVPGSTVSVFSIVVPANTLRKLTSIVVVTTHDGYFSLEANSLEIAKGRLDNVLHNISFKFDPPRPIPAGVTIELKYTADSDPVMSCSITSFLSANDFSV